MRDNRASAGGRAPAGTRWALARRIVMVISAAATGAALLGLLGFGLGPIPALGVALNPGRGVWNSASGGLLPHSETLSLPGLEKVARVSFTAAGVASIQAATDSDLYLSLGYVQAQFRLTQMDLERRLGEGRLAQLAGQPAVSSDKFELQLGLYRTAQAEWKATPRGSAAAEALIAYAAGVNDWLSQVRSSGQLPAIYALAGVRPGTWTPVDSLVVQEVLTQQLDFSTTPLDYALLEHSLGAARTMRWFPILPPDQQHPVDQGPYRNLGIASLATANANATPVASASQSAHQGTTAPMSAPVPEALGAAGAAHLLAEFGELPATAVHRFPDSNAWAANGPAIQGGRSMLAGDPHLLQTLPSYWYEVALRAPGIEVAGASLPGAPGVVIGHNQHIAWSITNTENQSTLFYSEKTSAQHPGQYFWRGSWRPMTRLRYTIPVRGGKPVALTVSLTVHGPILTTDGATTAVDWMGDYPSPDVAVLLNLDKATSVEQFKSALANWHAPTLNFVYADDRGNIGVLAAGYYPLVRAGDPWMPLSGTGQSDLAGTIPFAAVPQQYNPPAHFVVSANQRPVGPAYPYYIGTTLDDFDYGYRADALVAALRQPGMTMADYGRLQSNVTDHLATLIVPKLLTALGAGDAGLTRTERAAVQVLTGWNDAMTVRSAGASLWWYFWTDYLAAVFKPWWDSAKVPVHVDRSGLAVSTGLPSLDQDLETWTLHDQDNPAFTAPGQPAGDAAQAMRAAFASAVGRLARKLGGPPSSWSLGRVHSRQFPSLTGATALGYGPRPGTGDTWTIDAADGGAVSDFGPSWRMVVEWTPTATSRAIAIYPGGQSENPASPWYENLIGDWWDGRYLPLASAAHPAGDSIVWTLQPGSDRR